MGAVIEAASIRLRPILMTTFAMIASAIPLVLAGALVQPHAKILVG